MGRASESEALVRRKRADDKATEPEERRIWAFMIKYVRLKRLLVDSTSCNDRVKKKEREKRGLSVKDVEEAKEKEREEANGERDEGLLEFSFFLSLW